MTLEELDRQTGKILLAKVDFRQSARRYVDVISELYQYAGYDENMMDELKKLCKSFESSYENVYVNVDALHDKMWRYLLDIGNSSEEAKNALRAFTAKYPSADSLRNVGAITEGFRI